MIFLLAILALDLPFDVSGTGTGTVARLAT